MVLDAGTRYQLLRLTTQVYAGRVHHVLRLRVVGQDPVPQPTGEQLLPPGGSGSTGGEPAHIVSGPGSRPHVRQREPNWCGAACAEMAAGRLGVRVSQDEIAATSHFEPRFEVGGRTVSEGGFQSGGLMRALEEVAPVPGRRWVGGNFPQDIATPAALLEVVRGYLRATGTSIILRVRGGNHWIVVDDVTAEGRIVVRDPGAQGSALVTAEQLHGMHPVNEAVLSFPETD
jgi:hypothetical protein